MTITKHNYEEFFLLYVDNELNAQERKAVEDFVQVNPELREELETLLQTQLQAPELSFDKSLLYKPEAPVEEELLLRYIDNELDENGCRKVEQHAAENEAVAKELTLLRRTVLTPEIIPFKNKEVLYRQEARVVPIFTWRRMLAAASVLLLGGLLWISRDVLEPVGTPEIANVNPANQTQATKETHTAPLPGSKATDTAPAVTPAEETVEAERATTEDPVTGKIPPASASTLPAIEKIRQERMKTEEKTAIAKEAPVKILERVVGDNGPAIGIAAAQTNLTAPETAVKPLVLTEEDFTGDEKEVLAAVEPGLISLDEVDNKENKLNGNIRGFLRKTSRFINRSKVTEPDTEEESDKSVVRIASFAIAKK